MIHLTPELYLGKGRTRECFFDPRDPTRCIKVDFAARGCRQTVKEAKYYSKLARLKPGMDYDFIPRFHGFVETDRGLGGIFDLVRDEVTHEVSQTLGHYLRADAVRTELPKWEAALGRFLDRLMETGVIVRDLNPGNLCARKRADGTFQLIAIDGIGHRDFFPLCDYSNRLARRKLSRQINKKDMGSIAQILARIERKESLKKTPEGALAMVSS